MIKKNLNQRNQKNLGTNLNSSAHPTTTAKLATSGMSTLAISRDNLESILAQLTDIKTQNEQLKKLK